MIRVGGSASTAVLTAQHNLQRVSNEIAKTSTRLATLRRINRGSDDPAGLVAAEMLRSELTTLERESAAAERARALAHVADSGLAQATGLLNDIQANVVYAANGVTSDEERAALQMEVDAALEAINYIGRTTSFNGTSLLDGQLTLELGSLATAELTLPHVSTSSLGSDEGLLADLSSGGDASLAADSLGRSLDILDGAQQQLLDARAALGSFERYSIDATQAVLATQIVSVSAGMSLIVDADVAVETANLNRLSVLFDATAASLQLANLNVRAASGLLSGVFARRR